MHKSLDVRRDIDSLWPRDFLTKPYRMRLAQKTKTEVKTTEDEMKKFTQHNRMSGGPRKHARGTRDQLDFRFAA
jgi:hypothetical protein